MSMFVAHGVSAELQPAPQQARVLGSECRKRTAAGRVPNDPAAASCSRPHGLKQRCTRELEALRLRHRSAARWRGNDWGGLEISQLNQTRNSAQSARDTPFGYLVPALVQGANVIPIGRLHRA